MTVAQDIIDIVSKVPGIVGASVLRLNSEFEMIFRAVYNCPCGRKSHIACKIDDEVVPAQVIADDIIETLRQHVRSEGSEPVF